MTRGFHHTRNCVPTVWPTKCDYEERKWRRARGPAVWLKIQHLKCFTLDMKALWSFETSVSITSRHGVTSQKIWIFCWLCLTEMHPVRLFPSPWLKPMSGANSTSIQWKGTIFIRWGDWKRVGGPPALEGFRGCDVKGDRLTTTKNNFEIGSATFMTT